MNVDQRLVKKKNFFFFFLVDELCKLEISQVISMFFFSFLITKKEKQIKPKRFINKMMKALKKNRFFLLLQNQIDK